MNLFNNVQVHNCPACGNEYSDRQDDYVCSKCKYPVNLRADSKIIDWSKRIIQSLQKEKQINQRLTEELDRQNKQENNNCFDLFQQTINTISQPINNLTQEINSLTQEIKTLTQQQKYNSNLEQNNNLKAEENLKLSQQQKNLDESNEGDFLESENYFFDYIDCLENHEDEYANELYMSLDSISEDDFKKIKNDNSLNNSLQLVEKYNHDKHSLFKPSIATVAETVESMNNRRDGKSTPVQLEIKSSQGNYWIINEDGSDYLVPKSDIKINEYNFKTIEVLFECENCSNDYSTFRLIQPAKVTKISSDLWQLEEKGKLDFNKHHQ